MNELTSSIHKKINILIVEDEPLQAMKLEAMALDLGCHVVSVLDNAEAAVAQFRTVHIDLLLMDIMIKGKYDGIETVNMIHRIREVPVIFMTSYNTEMTFQRASRFEPEAFIVKPFTKEQLTRCIQLAVKRMDDIKEEIIEDPSDSNPIQTALFIRKKQKIIRVDKDDIYYLESDGKYSNIYTSDQKFVVRQSLSKLASTFNQDNFVQCHRSYIVNIRKIKTVDLNDDYLLLEERKIPMSRRERAKVLNLLKYLN